MASANALASRNFKQEIARAWDFERAYLPLLLDAVTIPTDGRYWLTTAQWHRTLNNRSSLPMPTPHQFERALTLLAIAELRAAAGERRRHAATRCLVYVRHRLTVPMRGRDFFKAAHN